MRALVATAGIVLAAVAAPMQLQSGDFTQNGVIPVRAMAVDCGGENRSPALSWNGESKATKSFAVVLHDPDAPMPGGFYHWVVYNLPPSTHKLPPDVKLGADQIGQTSLSRPGYYGPCPPPGPAHHYVFTLYALDLAHVAADSPLSVEELESRIAGHVLARAVLTGTESHR